jgi:EpsI family protein
MDGWLGRDDLLEAQIVSVLGVSDYVNRSYVNLGGEPVGLYVGYYQSQRSGETIHSPKNCLPGAGWNPAQSSVYMLPLDDGRKVPINLYVIRKGLESEVVLYWYQSHGRIIASEYWGKFYLVYDALRLNRTDAALVRITVPVQNGDEATAQERALSFAKQISGDLDQVIPR